jgi:cell division protein FtsQ
MNRRIIILFLSLVVIVVFTIVTLHNAAKQRKNATCTGIDVFFKQKEQFMSKREVEYIVHNNTKKLIGRNLQSLNTDELEKKIEKISWVKNSEVFIGYQKGDGNKLGSRLKIWIDQREPLFRVMHSNGGYYVDNEGKKMPFSTMNTKKVVVITGAISDKLIKEELIDFVNYINKNTFLKAQIEQIHIRKNREYVLVPRLGGHLIELGKAEDLDRKFKNLMALYDQGLSKVGWDLYRTVSLRYDNQIVCTKR